MGEAKRRRQAGKLTGAVTYPDDIKTDIAKIVRALAWVGAEGGTCFFRMPSGHRALVLRHLNIPSAMAPRQRRLRRAS